MTNINYFKEDTIRTGRCHWENEKLLITVRKTNGAYATYNTGIVMQVNDGQVFTLNDIPWVIKSLNPILAEMYDALYYTFHHPDVMVNDIFTDGKNYLVVKHDTPIQFVANKITFEEYDRIKKTNKNLADDFCRCDAIKKHGFKQTCEACIKYRKVEPKKEKVET